MVYGETLEVFWSWCLQAFCKMACISCKNGLATEVGLLAFKSGLNIVSKNLLDPNFRYA